LNLKFSNKNLACFVAFEFHYELFIIFTEKKKTIMRKLYSFILLAFFATAVIISCDDTVAPDLTMPDKNVSYSQHIQPLFNVSCALSGCHDNASAAGGLRLTSWVNTTADPQIVFPGEPDNSKLVWAIEGNTAVTPMPPVNGNVMPLTQNQIKGIRTWIAEGAKNN
jgi:hypothetical protein